LSWDPPNDVPNCVTGYYIEYDGMLYSTAGTSITVPVTNNTLNIYTVKATNGLMRNSTARSISVNVIDVSPVTNLNSTLNTSTCTEVTLSWDPPNDIPNCVTGYYIEYDGMLYSTAGTSITVPVTNNTLNVYTVKATNGLMRNSTARSISVNAGGPIVNNISLHVDPTSALLVISWDHTIPEISLGMTTLLVYLNNTEILNTGSDAMTLPITVFANMTYNVTLVAYNCFGSSSITGEFGNVYNYNYYEIYEYVYSTFT
jgi:ribosomal protein S8